MWSDSETDRDFLNFTGVAETVAEIIEQANGRPISIGVSGAWGTGKSSMMKLIRQSLDARQGESEHKYLFVDFNAWLYQGYDDARAALIEVVATALETEAKKSNRGVEKAVGLLKRVNWLRAMKLTAGSGIALALGLPPTGLLGELIKFGARALTGGLDAEALSDFEETAERAGKEASGLVKPRKETSPPKEIHAIRKALEDTLKEVEVTLVVLIDDLDRCLPETSVSTLEAIRLLLFLENTAFVIAADTQMIKHAVRRHFEGIDDEAAVTNYFDKLVQVPIRVPALGVQEVRAYMLLLFVENSEIDQVQKDRIRNAVCKQLSESWQGKRVDGRFVQSLGESAPHDLVGKFETADRLAPLMTTAVGVGGNPRLIKRFLNELSVRMAVGRAHGIGIDEAVLAKMLLLERCAATGCYEALARAVAEDGEGKPTFLCAWEESAVAGNGLALEGPWDSPFIREWLTVSPRLGDRDLRGVLFVSREHAPVTVGTDRLSSEGADLLEALVGQPDMAGSLRGQVSRLQRPELSIIMDTLLDRARREEEWGVPGILEACLVVGESDSEQANRVAAFLAERPTQQIKPNIVPRIGGYAWAKQVFDKWDKGEVSRPVKAAIKRQREDGDVTV